MTVKTKAPISPTIQTKARQLLEFTQKIAGTYSYSTNLFNAVFSPSGKAKDVLRDDEFDAFFKTKEYKAIRKLIDNLPRPPVQDYVADGIVSLRLPKSVYSALQKEADSEGVSVEQLCLSKLVAQLREPV